LDFDEELCADADDAFFSAPRPNRTEAFDPSEEAFDLFPVFPAVAVDSLDACAVFDDVLEPSGTFAFDSPAL